MKRKSPFILLLTFLLSIKIGLFAEADKYVKLANKVSINAENDSWLRVSIPFNILSHPGLEQFRTRRPSTVEELFNPEYVDDLKVKIFLCFTNEFKKKTLRSSQFPDSNFYQYYSAELTYETIKLDRNIKYANFLFPAAIAERDGFSSGYRNPTGYAIEISIGGRSMEISNAIMFDKYRDEATLLKFKQQAQEKSSANTNTLVPAHYIFPAYNLKDAKLEAFSPNN